MVYSVAISEFVTHMFSRIIYSFIRLAFPLSPQSVHQVFLGSRVLRGVKVLDYNNSHARVKNWLIRDVQMGLEGLEVDRLAPLKGNGKICQETIGETNYSWM